MTKIELSISVIATGMLAIATASSAAPKRTQSPTRPATPTKPAAKAAKLDGPAKWDGAYASDSAQGTDAGNQHGVLCPGEGINNGFYNVAGGTLSFNVHWVDDEDPRAGTKAANADKFPQNGHRVIPLTVKLVDVSDKERASKSASSTAMAKFDETVTIPALKLSENGKAVTFTEAHVYGTFLNLAAKGSDQAIMGTGRTAKVVVNIGGEPGSALAGCGDSRINALQGFTAADPSKGNFCSIETASCRTDAQCCSRSCSAHATGTTGKCVGTGR